MLNVTNDSRTASRSAPFVPCSDRTLENRSQEPFEIGVPLKFTEVELAAHASRCNALAPGTTAVKLLWLEAACGSGPPLEQPANANVRKRTPRGRACWAFMLPSC